MWSQEQLQSLLELLAQHKRGACRALMVLQGDQALLLARLQQLLMAMSWKDVVVLPNPQVTTSITHQLQKMLGTEIDALVINAYLGFNPNLLGVASGCIKAGGALIIMTPDNWSSYHDPDYQRMVSSINSDMIKGRFLQHVESIVHRLPASVFYEEKTQMMRMHQHPLIELFEPDFSEQNNLIAAIKKVANGRARRPLVVQSDRGCGKTSALGIAAAQLMLEKSARIVIVASQFNSVATLFRHACEILALQWRGQHAIDYQDSRLQFVAADAILHEAECDLVLVDEAAALPTALLQAIAHRFARCVFATTVFGYEGNGRGFSLRFLPYLQQHMQQVNIIQLNSPIRYAAHDPVSAFVDQSLLLSAWVAPDKSDNIEPSFTRLDRDELLRDEARLLQIMGLLIEAHYQTSADDIRLFLDHPDVELYALTTPASIIAIAVVMNEGGFSEEQQQSLVTGARRFRGHLLPQALAVGLDELLVMRFARVVRIAVQEKYRRQAYAKRLMLAIETQLNVDFIGASFSAEAELLQFWQSIDMQVVRFGHQQEASSGEYACIVVKPLNETARSHYAKLRHSYAQQLAYRLLAKQPLISSCLVVLLMNDCHFQIADNDIEKVQAYIQKRCSYESIEDAIFRFVLAYQHNLPCEKRLIITTKALKNLSWPDFCSEQSLSGRADAEKEIRIILATMLDI